MRRSRDFRVHQGGVGRSKRLVEQANAMAADLAPIVDEIRASGIAS
jgi:hypothetical protein